MTDPIASLTTVEVVGVAHPPGSPTSGDPNCGVEGCLLAGVTPHRHLTYEETVAGPPPAGPGEVVITVPYVGPIPTPEN